MELTRPEAVMRRMDAAGFGLRGAMANLARMLAIVDFEATGREHPRPRASSPPRYRRPPQDGDLGLQQQRPSAGTTPPPHTPRSPRPTPSPTSTPRPTNSPRLVSTPTSTPPVRPPRPSEDCSAPLRRLARPPNQLRTLRHPPRRQPHQPPMVHSPVLINEASVEDLLNAHTEGRFTQRQFARAAQRQAIVPPLRIRLINPVVTPPPRPEHQTLPNPAPGLPLPKHSIDRRHR